MSTGVGPSDQPEVPLPRNAVADHVLNTVTTKLFAHPIARLRSLQSGMIVGILYEWNTGERECAWISRPTRDIVHEAIDNAKAPAAG
jgi:hypothetical protein